jgi:hypothetical protein
MGFFDALKTGFTETVQGIAQDPKAFAKDVGSSFNDTAKSIVKGTAQVALDTGEAIPRVISTAMGKDQIVVPPTSLPGVIGKWLGPMQSYSSQVVQAQKEGKSTVAPITDFAMNEPAGMAAKPLFLGGGFILRQGVDRGAPLIKEMADKIGWTKSASKIKDYLGSIFDATPKDLAPLANELKGVTDPAKVEEIIHSKVTDTKIPTAPEGTDMFSHNLKNLNIPTEAKDKILNEVAPLKASMEKINGTPMTFTEVADQANKISQGLQNVIGKEETMNMAAQARNTSKELANVAEKMQKGAATKEDIIGLFDNFTKMDSYRSNAGRLLNDLKDSVSPQEFNLVNDMLGKMKKMGTTKEDFLKMSEKYDLNTPEGQLAMYRDLVKPNAEHWFDTLRMNSMLSSPATHFSNIIANYQGTGIMRPIVKGVEGAVDATRAILTGGLRTRFTGEVLPYLKGYYSPETIKTASKDAWNVLKGAIDVANVDLRQMPKVKPGTVLGGIESVLSVPMRALESMDIFFQRLTSAGEKAALDYRIAKGIKPSAVDTYGEAMYGVGGNAKKAEDIATKELFRSNIVQQGEGKLVNAVGQVARGLQHFTYNENPLVRIPAKLVLPFVRTPTNILKMGLEYNPLSGALNLFGNADKTQQISKIIVGASMMAPMITKGLSGEVTFGYPTDPAAREAQRAANIPEYSVKIGDNWYSYARMHPSIAFNLAMIGAVSQAVHENKYNEEKGTAIAQALAISSLKFLSGQAYLKSLGNFMDAMQGDEAKMAQFVSNVPQQAIPFRATLSWVNRLMNENQTKIDTEKGFGNQVLQSIMLQIPGLSDDLTPRTDINGKPLKNLGAFVEGNKYEAVMNALGITTSKVTDEDMKMYNSYNEARLYKKAISTQAKEDKKNLDAFVTVFKSLNNATEKKVALQNYMAANPQMQGKIIDALSNKPRTLTYEEKQIDSMPIKDGSRAKYIQARMKAMKTPEEKKAWLASLYKNKILTRDVLMSLTSTTKSGAPEPQIQGQ